MIENLEFMWVHIAKKQISLEQLCVFFFCPLLSHYIYHHRFLCLELTVGLLLSQTYGRIGLLASGMLNGKSHLNVENHVRKVFNGVFSLGVGSQN